MFTSWVFWVVAPLSLIIFLILFFSSFVITRQKTANIVEFLGKFHSVKSAGFSFKPIWPFGTVVANMNLKIQEIIEKVGIKTKDNVFLMMPVKVQLKVIESKVREAHYELDDPFTQISSYMVNVVRSKANDLTMDEIFQSKDAFETAVIEELKSRFEQYGYEVINVLVDDPVPSEEIKTAFDRVIASKRALEAATNEAEATRTKMVGEARAEAESLQIKADAYVKQRHIICTGLKEAIGLLDGVDGIDENRILDYLQGIDMRDTIRDASKGNGSIIVIPADMSTNGHMASTIGLTKALQVVPGATPA